MSYYSYADIEDAFFGALRDAGMEPARGERIRFDGSIQRFRIDGQKRGSKNGACAVYVDGDFAAGWYRDWSGANGPAGTVNWWWRPEGAKKPTPQEVAAAIARGEEARRIREAETQREQEKAVSRARQMWESATPYDMADEASVRKNDYPVCKKLSHAPSCRLFGSELLIPMYDFAGSLISVQRIYRDDNGVMTKRFLAGAPTAGAVLYLKGTGIPAKGKRLSIEDRGIIWLCEGWATGVSILEATGDDVIVAFSSGNLARAAEIARETRPELELAGAPDNDRGSRGNPGVSSMCSAQNGRWMPMVIPTFGENENGTDWNDYAYIHGAEATYDEISRQLDEQRGDPKFVNMLRSSMWVQTTEKGAPLRTYENLRALLSRLSIKVRYNMVTKMIEYTIPGKDYKGDNAQLAAEGYIQSKCIQYGIGTESFGSFVWTVACECQYDPIALWIKSRRWDGEDRLSELMDTISVPSTYKTYMKERLIKRWMISGVAAIFEGAGFRARGVLVLQGRQGIGKTSWLKNLFPKEHQNDWFGEGVSLDVNNKDSVKIATSKWCTELGEVESTFRRSDISRLKAFITNDVDEYRLPYARSESRFRRRTIFSATVNDRSFLRDETGNSRWWVVECDAIQHDHGIDSQQLWAQVYEELYLTGERWHLDAREEAALTSQNEEYATESSIEDAVRTRLDWDEPETLWRFMSVRDVLIGIGITDPQDQDVRKAGSTIRNLTGQRSVCKGKMRTRMYKVPSARKWSQTYAQDTSEQEST